MGFVLPAPTGLTGWGDDILNISLALRAERIDKKRIETQDALERERLRIQEKGVDADTAYKEAVVNLQEKGLGLDIQRFGLSERQFAADQSYRDQQLGLELQKFGLQQELGQSEIAGQESRTQYTNLLGKQIDWNLQIEKDVYEFRRAAEVAKAQGAKAQSKLLNMEADTIEGLSPEARTDYYTMKSTLEAARAQSYAQQASIDALQQQFRAMQIGLQVEEQENKEIQQKFDNWTGGGSLFRNLLPADSIPISNMIMGAARQSVGKDADPNVIQETLLTAYDMAKKAEDRRSKMELQESGARTQQQTLQQVIADSAKNKPEEWDTKSLREYKSSGVEVRPINAKYILSFTGLKPASKYIYYTQRQAEEAGLGDVWKLAPTTGQDFLDMTIQGVGPQDMRVGDGAAADFYKDMGRK